MFRRHTPETSAPESVVKPDGKGRPTPSRKEAEAAARERARLPRDRKAMMRRQRELRVESSRKLREGLKAGDEKALPPRDQGPVRRFVRDLVDSRIRFGDLLVPILMLMVIFGYGFAGKQAAVVANAAMLPVMFLVVLEMVVLRFRLRREVRQRFPDEPVKGLTSYAVMRALNMRFLRLPKPRVKIGQPLPDTYR